MPDCPGTRITVAAAAILGAAVLLVTGCRTLPGTEKVFHIPHPSEAVLIASGEGEFVRRNLQDVLVDVMGEDVRTALTRSRNISLALFPDGALTVLLEGRYSRLFTSLALNFSCDWKRVPETSATWRLKDGDAEITLPQGGQLIYGVPASGRMFSAIKERSVTGHPRKESLEILIPAVKKLSPEAPADGECRISGEWADDTLVLSISWRFKDSLSARASHPLVRLSLWRYLKRINPEYEIRSLDTDRDNETIYIEGLRLKSDEIRTVVNDFLSGEI